MSVIIAYNVTDFVDKVVGHWICLYNIESQCVDYMALTCMSIVESNTAVVGEKFDTTSTQELGSLFWNEFH